jgi:schlafen family protein
MSGAGELQGIRFEIPEISGQASTTRIPSRMRLRSVYDLTLPHDRYIVKAKTRRERPQWDSRPLVRHGCPSFPNVISAAYWFLYGAVYQPGQSLPDDDIVMRIPRPEAWIDKVTFYPNSFTVAVRGTEVAGVRLEVRGDAGLYVDSNVDAADDLSFPLSSGLPSRLWIILSRCDRWLDYRDLDFRASSPWDNVSFEAGSTVEQIEALACRGESETIEYKVKLPVRDDDFLKTIAAFANGDGGVLIVGVSDNPVEIRGLVVDISAEMGRITNMIRDRISPEPVTRIESCEIESKQVVAIFVERGREPPYGVGPKKLVYYVRRSASTYPATQAEVCALVRQRDSQEKQDSSGLLW